MLPQQVGNSGSCCHDAPHSGLEWIVGAWRRGHQSRENTAGLSLVHMQSMVGK